MKTYGGILAGGIGSRMATKDGLPKQFLEIGGVPVIVRTVRRFLECSGLDGIVIAMHRDWREYAAELFARHGLEMGRIEMIDGGDTRFESLVNLAEGCLVMAERVGERDEILMINHDCARPFVSVDILQRNIAAAQEYDMATTSIPTIDTVLISKDGKVSDCVPERATVFCDQGPQTIKVRHFLNLVETLSAAERQRYMEAGRLYIDKGFKVAIVEGNRYNFKLTTPLDVVVAEELLRLGVM